VVTWVSRDFLTVKGDWGSTIDGTREDEGAIAPSRLVTWGVTTLPRGESSRTMFSRDRVSDTSRDFAGVEAVIGATAPSLAPGGSNSGPPRSEFEEDFESLDIETSRDEGPEPVARSRALLTSRDLGGGGAGLLAGLRVGDLSGVVGSRGLNWSWELSSWMLPRSRDCSRDGGGCGFRKSRFGVSGGPVLCTCCLGEIGSVFSIVGAIWRSRNVPLRWTGLAATFGLCGLVCSCLLAVSGFGSGFGGFFPGFGGISGFDFSILDAATSVLSPSGFFPTAGGCFDMFEAVCWVTLGRMRCVLLLIE
jgi:hypothetical protein